MKKVLLAIAAAIGLLAALIVINPQINPSHTTPFLSLDEERVGPAPAEPEVIQRVILYGDAGHSSMEPWQASMAMVAERASIAPEKTAVVALGDNIYMRGYPQKDTDQEEWDAGQLESISFLDAQLRVAKESGARFYLVPGNHDWYATELGGQAAHVAEYAEKHGVHTEFHPYHNTGPQLPTAVDLPGVSIFFLDSEWLLHAAGEDREQAFSHLGNLLAASRTAHPDNLLLLTAHHPLETMGQHGGYLAEFAYWFFIRTIYFFFPEAEDEDTYSPIYKEMIADLNEQMAPFEKVIYAAGHEHSLQVFRHAGEKNPWPDYSLVSGAGNSNKVSGVWHNHNTRFALSQEGFMELAITEAGIHLQVFDIHHEEAVAEFWLTTP